MTTTNTAETLTPSAYYRSTALAVAEGGRWISGDKIEVCKCPEFPGRSPERRYVAQRLSGGPCAWGATKEAAAAAVREVA